MEELKVTQIESFANVNNEPHDVFFGLVARAGMVDPSDAITLKPLERYLRTIQQSIKERIENEKGCICPSLTDSVPGRALELEEGPPNHRRQLAEPIKYNGIFDKPAEFEKEGMSVRARRASIRTMAPDRAGRAVLAFHYGVFKDNMPVLWVKHVSK